MAGYYPYEVLAWHDGEMIRLDTMVAGDSRVTSCYIIHWDSCPPPRAVRGPPGNFRGGGAREIENVTA